MHCKTDQSQYSNWRVSSSKVSVVCPIAGTGAACEENVLWGKHEMARKRLALGVRPVYSPGC